MVEIVTIWEDGAVREWRVPYHASLEAAVREADEHLEGMGTPRAVRITGWFEPE